MTAIVSLKKLRCVLHGRAVPALFVGVLAAFGIIALFAVRHIANKL
jgi:hypothetical protein